MILTKAFFSSSSGVLSEGGFQFSGYTNGDKKYKIGNPAKVRDEVRQVAQTIIDGQRKISIQKKKLPDTGANATIFEKADTPS